LLQRSRKYKNSNYEVIWIFGTENYDIKNLTKNISDFTSNYRTIASEREVIFNEDLPLIYFNPDSNIIYKMKYNNTKSVPKRSTIFNISFEVKQLCNFDFVEFLNNKPYSNVKNNFKDWIDGIGDLSIFEFKKETKLINPTVCFEIDNLQYGIEYIRKPLNEDIYQNMIKEYKKYNLTPIILLDSVLYRVSGSKYIAYSIIDKNYYNPETNELSILSHVGQELWYGYNSSYYMEVFNPCTTSLLECWFVGNSIENKLSNEYSFKDSIFKARKTKEKYKNDSYLEQEKLYKEAENYKILNTPLVFLDGNFKIEYDDFCLNLLNIFDKHDRNYMLHCVKNKVRRDNYKTTFIWHSKAVIEGQSISEHRRLNIIQEFKSCGFTNISFYKEDVNGSK
jgi:hypothetical protein